MSLFSYYFKYIKGFSEKHCAFINVPLDIKNYSKLYRNDLLLPAIKSFLSANGDGTERKKKKTLIEGQTNCQC